ncbi:NO-inducible flavohemoprotein [Thalassomonas actiniarum]|uniref:nitric oxide dioxygenase n=1 Tax=Thalassomonas actiniarum TaxID=485447 RepID=A0AAF0C6M6_9GAMM|nr:NO-inducible flavohemoprotein [Thalassomonas actiniarum]WDE02265.1 NO-inducible flavohemoprotein [Thalassomonas actiniarum]
MLDAQTIEIIKSTVPVLKVHADDITKAFYPLLFSQHPDVVPYFNQTNQGKGTQPKALANAVVAYGANIDALGNLSETVSKIVQKHVALGIEPSQYDAVGSCLLQAIKAVLGDAATEEIITAWGKAYGQLAELLITAEESLYAENESKPGGWRGEREFTLAKRVDESAVITSFYFEPVDGKGVPLFEPGQFLTIILDDVDGARLRRNYSLSDAPGSHYLRISVKREPDGAVSNHLHNNLNPGDRVKLTHPSGDFTLRKNNKPLVLLTGGVGITPAISMLNSEAGSGRDIRFIHAALNSDVHAFKAHVDQLASLHDHISPLYVYSNPEENCQPHATGFITEELVARQLPQDRDVELYFLGPVPFMRAALKIAKNLGLPDAQVHYEFFGPSEELIA